MSKVGQKRTRVNKETASSKLFKLNKDTIYSIIKDNYVNGLNCSDIADGLNDLNHKTITGCGWTPSSVSYTATSILGIDRRHSFHNKASSEKSSSKIDDALNLDDNIVFEKDGQVFTNSRYVAKTFEKRHDNVLSAIQNLLADKQELLLNFKESFYLNSNTKEQPMYLIDDFGFSILVMGFTGSKALDFKLAYAKRFKEMSNLINSRALPPPPAPELSTLDFLALTVKSMQEQRQDITQINSKLTSIESKLEQHEIKEKARELDKQQALNELKDIKYSDKLPFETPVRKKILTIVNNYINIKFPTPTKLDYSFVWRKLCTEVYSRLGYDIQTRKENSEAKGIKKNRLDIMSDLGILDNVFDIVSLIFRVDKLST